MKKLMEMEKDKPPFESSWLAVKGPLMTRKLCETCTTTYNYCGSDMIPEWCVRCWPRPPIKDGSWWTNKKNGKLYRVLRSDIINATNDAIAQTMVLYYVYEPVDVPELAPLFVREINEFQEKFQETSYQEAKDKGLVFSSTAQGSDQSGS